MIRLISVVLNETEEFEITFSNLNYQLRRNKEVVFEDLNFSNVRDRLFKESGV